MKKGFTALSMTMEPLLEIDDQVFVAEAPELGCAAEGWCYEAALLNLKIKIADFLDMVERAGKSVPEPRRRQRSDF